MYDIAVIRSEIITILWEWLEIILECAEKVIIWKLHDTTLKVEEYYESKSWRNGIMIILHGKAMMKPVYAWRYKEGLQKLLWFCSLLCFFNNLGITAVNRALVWNSFTIVDATILNPVCCSFSLTWRKLCVYVYNVHYLLLAIRYFVFHFKYT